MSTKIRTIITQDGEIDDQNSLRHALLYANDMEIQGIILTSSIFHFQGVKSALTPENKPDYTKPYRFTGTTWMDEMIEDYKQVYPNLIQVDTNYPTPEYLHSITKIGNIGYPGEMLQASDGSILIKEKILDQDPRKLYIQLWGGANTLARALYDLEQEYKNQDNWLEIKKQIEDKVIITACGEQDDTYKNYICEVYPNMQFVKCVQMGSYAYAWNNMPEGKSKETLRAPFMQEHILKNTGALLEKYATWADGKEYEGEEINSQFGCNEKLLHEWWGKEMGLGTYQPYEFISEGDSPTFLTLLPWGFKTLESFNYGGIAGRYQLDPTYKNSKGQQVNYWIPMTCHYQQEDGKLVETESMWPYVEAIQKDFAARGAWCTLRYKTLPPQIHLIEDDSQIAFANQTITLNVQANDQVDFDFIYNQDVSNYPYKLTLNKNKTSVTFTIDPSAKENDFISLIIKATTKDAFEVTRYKQIILSIK